MPEKITTRAIWARHTSTDGKAYVQEHVVWDADLFIATRQAEAANANAAQKGDAPRLAAVNQITQEQYLVERKAA